MSSHTLIQRRQRVRLLALLTVALVVLAACGSSDDDKSAGSKAASTKQPTGTPITLVSIVNNSDTSQFPSVAAGAKAAAKELNDAGGIDGRPVTIKICDTKNDANVAAACARDAVSDENVLGVVGGYEPLGGGIVPILEAGGLRMYSPYPTGQPYYQSKIAFPISAGSLGNTIGAISLLPLVLHETDYCTIIGDFPAARPVAALANSVLKEAGAPPIPHVYYVDIATPDFSPQIAAISKTEGCNVALPEAVAQRFIKQARQQGYKGTFSVSGVTLQRPSLIALGDAAEGIYVSGSFRRGIPASDRIEKAIQAMDPKAQGDDLGFTAYFGVKMFAEAASSATELTRPALAEAIGALKTFDTEGTTPTLDLTKESTVLGGGFPRLTNTSVYLLQWKGDALEPVLDDFFNVLAPKKG